jgi:sec-independent protein translocase protein TatA
MMELGAGEILVIMAIVLLLFGPSKLPRLGEGLGRALRNFKDALHSEEHGSSDEDTKPRAQEPARLGENGPPAAPGGEPSREPDRSSATASSTRR